MKTIIIWDQCGEASLQYAVLEGDYDYLDGVYLNGDSDPDLVEELNDIYPGLELDEAFPYDATAEAFKVVRCGFYP